MGLATLTAAQQQALDTASPANELVKPGKNIADLQTRATALEGVGIQGVATATLTAAAAAAGVTILEDSVVTAVGASAKVYVQAIRLTVLGGTAWTDATATKVSIKDTADVVVSDIAKAGLTANAKLFDQAATMANHQNVIDAVGFTAGKGLKILGDANFGAGSDIHVRVDYRIK